LTFSFHSQTALFALGGALLEKHPARGPQPRSQGNRDRHPRSESKAVATNGLPKSIPGARRTSGDGLVVEETFDVFGEPVCGFVTTGAVFLQALHHNPVEIAAQGMDEAEGLGAPSF